MLLGHNFDFPIGYCLLPSRYCWLLLGTWWFLVVTARYLWLMLVTASYCSFPLLVWTQIYSKNICKPNISQLPKHKFIKHGRFITEKFANVLEWKSRNSTPQTSGLLYIPGFSHNIAAMPLPNVTDIISKRHGENTLSVLFMIYISSSQNLMVYITRELGKTSVGKSSP